MRSVTYWFVVIVALTVAAAIAPSPTAAQTPPAAPALPTVFIDTTLGSQPGVNRNVGTTSPGVGDRTGFINALNAAQFGDTIVLTAGAVYQGPYTLPIPQAGPGQWVVITTSDSTFLPPPGTRLVPMQAAVPPGMVANIDAAHLAKISTKLDDNGVLAVKGAHHYRFIGVEFFPAFTVPGQDYGGSIVDLGTLVDAQGRAVATNADYPHDIIFDRCYFHGGVQNQTRRGLRGNANALAVIDSYFADFKEMANDTQALSIDHTNGPFKIVNNYLEGAGENIIFGGGDPVVTNNIPADIEIRNNFFFKPVSWRFFDPTFGAPGSALTLTPGGTLSSNGTTVTTTVPHGINGAAILGSSNGDMILLTSGPQSGQMRRVVAIVNSTTLTIESAFSANQAGVTWSDLRAWVVKNLFELKNAQRVLVEGNVFMQNWGGQGQSGSAIGITVRNQDGTAPWSNVTDVTFRKNILHSSGQAFNVHGKDPDFPSQRSVRMAVTDNVIDDINSSWMPPGGSSQDGRMFLINRGLVDFRFEHNTIVHTGHVLVTTNNLGPEPGTIGCPITPGASGPCNVPNNRFVFRNNLLRHNLDGFISDIGFANQNNSLTTAYTNFDFANNLLAGPFPTTDGVNHTLYGSFDNPVNFFDVTPGNFASSLNLGAGSFYVNPAAEDYHLAGGNIYAAAGSRPARLLGGTADGKDMGADVDAVTLATQGVISGVPGSASLMVGKLGSGTGTVTSSPAGINCGADCTEIYPTGTMVTLTAMPGAGSLFTGFAGACSGTGPCMLTLNSDKVVSATFSLASVLQFSAPTYSVNENGGTATITVTRTGATTGTVTAQFATSNGTAVAPGDYTTSSGTLTFTSGASQTFTVPVVDNTAVTGNKTVNLTLSNPGGAGGQLGTQTTAVLTITDNDAAGSVQFSAAAASVSEAAGTTNLTVNRTGGSASGVTVDYAVTGGTAPNDGTRFVLNSGTLNFGAGVTSQPISVTLVNNTIVDGSKTVVVTLSNPQGGAALGAVTATTLTITDEDQGGSIQFSAATASVAENVAGGTTNLTVTRTGGTASGVTVNYAVTGGTAAGSRFSLPSGTLTFNAGDTSKQIPVTINNDTVVNGNGTVIVTLSGPTGGATLGATSATALTITDDDQGGTIQFASATATVAENVVGGATVLTVNRTGGSAGNVTVSYAVTGGTAPHTRFTLTAGTLTFNAGDTSKNIPVTILDNALIDGNVTVLVTLSGPTGGATLGAQSSMTLTIVDDDTSLQFSAATYQVNENAGTATVTVTRTGATTAAITVPFATSNGTAVAGTDYMTSSGTLSFAAGATSMTFTVAITDNTVVNANNTINLTLSTPGGPSAVLGSPSTAVLTIVENDHAGTLQFGAATASVAENVAGGATTLGVTRTGGAASGVTVDYAVTGGTAPGNGAPGSRFTLAAGTLTFNAGDTSQNIPVTIIDNAIADGDQTVVVTLSNPHGGGALGAQTSTTLTIVDNEVSLHFSAATYQVNENGATATITVNRGGPTTAQVTVDFADAGGGSATSGQHYSVTPGTLTFGPGMTARTFTVAIVDNTVVDGNKTVNLKLQNPLPGGTALLGAQSTATLTIVDNDQGGSLRFASATASVSEGVAGSTTNLTVTRTGGAASNVKVDYAVTGGTAPNNGSRFVLGSGTLTFGAAETSKTIPVTIVNNTVVDGNVTVVVALSNPQNGGALGAQTSTTLTIVDDDQGGALQFGSGSIAVSEAVGQMPITVTRTGGVASGVTVDFSIVGGTAVQDVDFTFTPGTLTFAAGQTTQVISSMVMLINPNITGNQTIIVGLSNPQGGASLGTLVTTTVTVLDAEIGLQFSAPAYTVAENGGAATITVTRTGPSAPVVTVNFATSNGTAVAGSDYTTSTGTLTFGAGITARTFTVPIIDNTVVDGNRTLNLALTNAQPSAGPNAAGVVVGHGTATLTIQDNDVAGSIGFGASTVTVPVGASGASGPAATTVPATLTVTRTGGGAGNVTVDFAVTPGTAVAGTDFTPVTGTLTFGAGETTKTITVQLHKNSLARGTRTALVSLSNPGSGAALRAPNPSTLSIANTNLGGAIAFSAATYSVSENVAGGLATITVVRTGGTASGVTVQFGTSDGTAHAGVDYTATSGVLTFGAGETSKTFTVPIASDITVNGNRTLGLTLSSPTDGATLGTLTAATLTIVDDEVGLQFAAATPSVAENAGMATITVTRSGPTTDTVMVNFATVAGGTAVTNTDFTPVTGTLTFGAGVTSKTFTVPIKDNTVVDGNRTINLQLSSPAGPGALLGTPSAAVLTIVDNDLGGTLKFSAATAMVTEGTPTALLTVSRTGGAASGVTVQFAATGGTAVNGTDYTLAAGTLTFNAGDASKTIAVAITDDTRVNGDRTVVVTLSNALGGAALAAPTATTLTIKNNDSGGTLAFSAAAYSVNESAGTATITVTRTGGVAGNVTVDFATSDGTAVASTDYTTAGGTLTFGPNEKTRTFTVSVANPTTVNGHRTVNLALSNAGGGGVLGAVKNATLTILDNQSGLQFSAPVFTVNENTPAATITVVRFGSTVGTLTAQFATSNGTAIAGTDYTTAAGSLTFGPGILSKTFTVPIKDNTGVNANKTLTLTLSNLTQTGVSGAVGFGVVNPATLTIVNNDLGGVLSFSAATASVTEGMPTASLTVNRTGGVAGGVTVQFAATAGTAVNGTDYTLAPGTLAFNAGETSKTIPVTITNDTIVNGTRTVVVTLSNPQGGATVGATSATTLSILDNDLGGSLAFSAAAYTVSENVAAGTATITVTRTGGAASGVTVAFATSDGTAVAGTDYTAAGGTLTFGAGETTKTFTVAVNNLPTPNGNRTLNLALSAPGGGGALGAVKNATLTILDTQAGVQFSSTTYTVNENSATATITVVRFGPTTGSIIVPFATSDGSAHAPADYTATSGVLTLGPGMMSKTFTVPIKDNTVVDGNKTVILTLSSPTGIGTGTLGLGVVNPATLTIVDNDLGGSVKFSAATFMVTEGTPTAMLTVTRSGGAASGVSVDFAATGGTAVNGTDYTLAPGTLTFKAGETSRTIPVTVTNNTIVDGSRTVIVTLSNPQGGASLGAPSATTLTLKDNDVAGTVAFSAATFTVNETAATATITVNRSGGAASAVTVNFAATGGTAVNGTEYTLAAGTLTFNAGETSKTFAVTINNGTTANGNRTVVLTLSGPGGGAAVGTPSTATLTIVNDDVAGSVAFSSPTYSVSQTAGTFDVTVVRTGGAASGVSADFSVVAGGTAVSGVDFTLTPGTVTFGAGETTKTFTVTINNTGGAGSRTILLHLTNALGGATLGAPSAATLTITP